MQGDARCFSLLPGEGSRVVVRWEEKPRQGSEEAEAG